MLEEVRDCFAGARVRVPFPIGTMIEVPRAALTADRIARSADFFSFGTNDLTQMTYALSRDDAARFLPDLPRDAASSPTIRSRRSTRTASAC